MKPSCKEFNPLEHLDETEADLFLEDILEMDLVCRVPEILLAHRKVEFMLAIECLKSKLQTIV